MTGVAGAPNLAVVDAITQFVGGTQAVWNNVTIPIPAGLVIYATDTTVVKLGDGVTLYVNLPVILTLNTLSSMQQQLTSLTSGGSGSGTSTFQTAAQVTTAINAALAAYTTTAALATELQAYVTTNGLNGYVTIGSFNQQLTDLITQAQLTNTLSGYVTQQQLSTAVEGSATQSFSCANPTSPFQAVNLQTLNGSLVNSKNTGIFIQVTSSTSLSVKASSLILSNMTGTGAVKVTNINTTINTAVNGIGGLDTGVMTANTWYYVFAVNNGTTSGTGIVISTNSILPLQSTAGQPYPYYVRIGSIITNSSAHLIGTLQINGRVRYLLGGPNVTDLPVMAVGGTPLNTSIPSVVNGEAYIYNIVPISVNSFVSIFAQSIDIILDGSNAGFSGYVNGVPITSFGAIAPNNSYNISAVGSGYGDLMFLTGQVEVSGVTSSIGQVAVSGNVLLESRNIYYSGNGPGTMVHCAGWEESI